MPVIWDRKLFFKCDTKSLPSRKWLSSRGEFAYLQINSVWLEPVAWLRFRFEHQPCSNPGLAFSRLILGDIAGDGNMCSETVDGEVEKSAYSTPPLDIQITCWLIRNAGKSRSKAVKPTSIPHSYLILKTWKQVWEKPPLHELRTEMITFWALYPKSLAYKYLNGVCRIVPMKDACCSRNHSSDTTLSRNVYSLSYYRISFIFLL